jgi:hypothetical protein
MSACTAIGAVPSAISSAVITSTTPGSVRARETSTDVMRAWARGLRTKTACSIPVSCRSST